MANKVFGVDMPPATIPLTGSETLSVMQGGVLSDCTAQDIANLTPASSGDVVGPASSVSNRVAVFSGTTGKLLADGGKTIAAIESSAVASARTPNVQAVTSSATVTPTFSNDLVKITAQSAALLLANPAGTAVDGWGIVIRIKDDGTARAITYGAQYRAIGLTLPTTTVSGKTLYIAGVWNSEETFLDVVAVGQQA